MAINWDGFIMGVGDYTTERLKEERAMKMKEKLAELQEKYDVAAEGRRQAYEAKKVKGSRDAAGQPGMVEDVNEFGEVVGTRRLDEFSQQQREQDRQVFEVGIKDKESAIQARNRQLELEAERNAISRDRNSIERQAASAASAGASGSRNDAAELVGLVGFKPPTAGDAVGNRNYLRLLRAADEALLWGKANNVPDPEKILQRFRSTALTEDYLEDGQ